MSLSTHTKRRKRACSMDNFPNVLVNASEFMKGRLYFVSLNTDVKPKSTSTVHYFSIDSEFRYENFYKDFGPLNLSMLYHYCTKIQKKLSSVSFQNKKIVHYTGPDDEKRVNAAYLIGCYSILYLKFEPNQAHDILMKETKKPYLEFRDASCGEPYNLSLLDCLKAIKKAHDYNFFNFNNFDHVDYEHYERVEHGDLNWIVPNKFIAFCGPHNKAENYNGYYVHSPETYFGYFRRNGVSTIVRLNYEAYEANKFVVAGFEHKDLYFVDGGTPNDRIMDLFLKISEDAKGAIAVHCKAGLGRTGTLIACYIIKHYNFSADEAIAWIRICRPGSVIGHQQSWLHAKEKQLRNAGEAYRKQKGISVIKHTIGIYPLTKYERKNNGNVTGIVKKVDCMEITDRNDNYKIEESVKSTQGDKLNEIKAQRLKTKPIIANIYEPRLFRTKVHVNGVGAPNSKTTRIVATSQTKVTHTSRHVLAKRNEVTEPTTRRMSQRKLVATLSTSSADKPKTTATVNIQKKKENVVGWFPVGKEVDTKNTDSVVSKTIKRPKRTLTLEQDKISPRSVKILRRSHGVTTNETCKKDGKSNLPAARLNKTL
ncbi:hypothetical protein HHI36_022814 [Cryptolaemus montrouzieri]|uniref:protein-tyrosine-phosphatase n=1 Tax=Cryptolaemus montrouzieri TaxID=559131 RepID=A0ABD2PEI0_9CUCU